MLTRKIVTKLAALSIMLFSLGFVVTAGAAKAPKALCTLCYQGQPKGIWRYCQWEVQHGDPCLLPPSDDYCIFTNPYCDPI